MKKLFSLFLSVVMLLSVTAGLDLTAYAETDGKFTYTVLDDGTAEITGYTGSAADLTIPSALDGYTVTGIGEWAFSGCTSLTSVTIPDSVTSIGGSAFNYCTSLTSVTIPNSVTSIGWYAFCDCTSLTSITIPNSVTSIGDKAFSGCTSLTSITIPDSVTSIGDGAFAGCESLTSITADEKNPNYISADGVLFNKEKTELIQYPIGNTRSTYVIPNSVTSIGDWAFYDYTSLTSITIPDSVTSIGEYAFSDCASLTDVTIGNSVSSIGDSAFFECTSLTSITIPNSVTSIGVYAFGLCTSLTDVTIGNSVTSIGNGAFYYCTSLTSITIPNSVTSIGDWAFFGCPSLMDVYYDGSKRDWNKISIDGANDDLLDATIHYQGEQTHEHTWNTGVITKQPSCKEPGVRTYICTSCNAAYTQEIPKLEHTVVTDGAVASTCTQTGLTEGRRCAACGEILIAQQTIPATGHNFGSNSAICLVCGAANPNYVAPNQPAVIDASGFTVKLAKTKYAYNGKVKKPAVTVYDKNGKELSGSDYTLTYTGNANPGKKKVVIKFKGSYSGTITKYYKIIPKKQTISSLRSTGKKKIKVTWKKDKTVSGYQVQYSTSKKFYKSKSKSAFVSKKNTSKTISKLKSGKRYYVRVRAYKTIDGKKVYGSWSSVKSVKVK